MIYLSTDCEQPLTDRGRGLWSLKLPSGEDRSAVSHLLQNEHIWFLSSYGGCSCYFRTFPSNDPNPTFGNPEKWVPEEPDEVEATGQIFEFLRELIASGRKVDLVDFWNDPPDEVAEISVSLGSVGRENFRFFESYRFELLPNAHDRISNPRSCEEEFASDQILRRF